ncbi:hypothetical protein [Acrocarpospora macrocephala]|uniref:hypothetical protein n=1 Tax=Acrocarpospora macrocephala TaxID=150177 RepID=UPI0012D31A6A|nr:hypothetical protein [Acrocarpospora macrocephala]
MFQVTEKAEKDSDSECAPGSRQRFFRAQGNFARPGQQSPGAAAGLIRSGLAALEYEEVVAPLDLFDDELSVVVVRNAEAAVTFIVSARTSPEPNIRIVGKTDCFEAGE